MRRLVFQRSSQRAAGKRAEPEITVGGDHRWAIVDRLLHDTTHQAAHPHRRTIPPAVRPTAVTDRGDEDQPDQPHRRLLAVRFAAILIPMPAPLDALIAEHRAARHEPARLTRNRLALPGGSPGRHLNTESIRAQLVAIGIKPYEGRTATLFQLAADMPAPVLGELIGISNNDAGDWARLVARDWRSYIADRDR